MTEAPEYPDTAAGRAAQWLDTIAGEHTHPDSMDHDHMKENAGQLGRLFSGTSVVAAEMHEVSFQLALNVAETVMTSGEVSIADLVTMFQGVCTSGAAIGARVQAGLAA